MIEGYDAFTPIGHGGFSTVYLAHQQIFDRQVAVKVLHADLSDPGAQRRFVRECRATGRLTGHLHVVTVFDAGATTDARPYLAMEYFPAGSLADRLKQAGPMDVPSVVTTGLAVGGALDAAHSAGILHRDLKPANVLVRAPQHPVLSDFGIASVDLGADAATVSAAFTPGYAAPEVLLGEEPSPVSDVFALGATLFALLRGTPPYPGRVPTQVLARILDGGPEPLYRDDVPADLIDLLTRMLDREPARRPAAADVVIQLRALAPRQEAFAALTQVQAGEPQTFVPRSSAVLSAAVPPAKATATATATTAAAVSPAFVTAPPQGQPAGTTTGTAFSNEPPHNEPPRPGTARMAGDGGIGPSPTRRRRRIARWIPVSAIAVLAVLAVALGGFVLLRPGSDGEGARARRNAQVTVSPDGAAAAKGAGGSSASRGTEPTPSGSLDPEDAATAAPATAGPDSASAAPPGPGATVPGLPGRPGVNPPPAATVAPVVPPAPPATQAPPGPGCAARTEVTTDYAGRRHTSRYYCSTYVAYSVYANVGAGQAGETLDDSGWMYEASSVWVICQLQGRSNPVVQGNTNTWWLYTQGDESRTNTHGYSSAWGYLPATVVTVGGQNEPIPGVPACGSYL